jgi:2'-5' RNA ligase
MVAMITSPAIAGDKEKLTNPITAIDILLEPDATMLTHAAAANERIRKNFPEGFALDESHRPHITTLQRFVTTEDLPKIYDALGKILSKENPSVWKLKAYKYYYLSYNGLGLAGIVIGPTDDLIRFQQKVIDAVTPFTVKTGTASAFVTTKEGPNINQQTIDYIVTYVPNQVGRKFNPHVTIGLAHEDYLKKMLKDKFQDFSFSVIGLSVYHLGNFGTARKKLKSWDFKR